MGITEELFGIPAVKKTEPEPEQKKEEEKGTETTEVTTQEPKPYSSEELKGLFELHPKDFLKQIELERVDPLYRPMVEKTIEEYRGLKEALTKKSQEAADLKKKEEKPQKERTIFDDFQDDPEATISRIDGYILDLLNQSDQLDEEEDRKGSRKAYRAAMEWSAIKSTLLTKGFVQFKKESGEETKLRKALDAFPDYETKRDYLVKFVMKQSPDFTEEEAADLIDATKGMKSVKLAKLLMKFAEQSSAKETIEGKIVKETPLALGRPGSSQPTETKKEDFDYDAEFEKARKAGDMTKSPNFYDLLKSKGAI